MRYIWVSLVFLAAMLVLHILFPSMLNGFGGEVYKLNGVLSDEFIKATLDYHNILPAFARRPIMSFFLEFFHITFGLRYSIAFILLGFATLFCSGMLVAFLGRMFGLTKKAAQVSVVFFYSGMTIFFAFFGPMYSYDDPFQYVFLLLSLCFLYTRRYVLFVVVFFFALVARETSIILLPTMVFFCFSKDKHMWSFSCIWFKVVLCAIPVLMYGLFLFLFLQHTNMLAPTQEYMGGERFVHWQFNFQSMQFGVETVFSIILPLLIPTMVLWYYTKHHTVTLFEKRLTYAYIVSIIINTIIVVVTARAREARLFALPLIFLWPILGKYALVVMSYWGKRLYVIAKKQRTVFVRYCVYYVFFVTLVASIVRYAYRPTAAWGFERGYKLYALGVVAVYCFMVFVEWFLKKQASKHKKVGRCT
ncbi:MAG: hypothetical protein HOL80_03470 [Candidatus Magasanikbacteria bacterium]|jgi:hypothetical protein|nr:hypothetical protein [Candidatus Magasanikbacteria bacterium]MBT6294615.1 hypothetical protein [Candidatus Magasanikbacteria bacterium]